MRRKFRKPGVLLLAIGILALAFAFAYALQPEAAAAGAGESLTYKVEGETPRLNRKVTGEVTAWVQGVPAEPVDSFVWDGDGSELIDDGSATLEIDPVANTGTIRAEWMDRNGQWTLEQTAFHPPHHASGMKAVSLNETIFVEEDPVTVDVYLHGDTTAGGPVLPTIFNQLATWGPAEVTLNGEPFENPYDGPTPLWVAHTMTTAGVRNDDGTVRMADGTFYHPTKRGGEGAIDYDDRELHIVFHDAPGPEMTANFPPPLSFFYHLTFEDVKVEIDHSE